MIEIVSFYLLVFNLVKFPTKQLPIVAQVQQVIQLVSQFKILHVETLQKKQKIGPM